MYYYSKMKWSEEDSRSGERQGDDMGWVRGIDVEPRAGEKARDKRKLAETSTKNANNKQNE
jgi:hypothetical protein